MDRKRTGFGTSSGFELAAIGSAVGLGNIWGFPYKTSANGGAAYLFVYLLCILLVGAVAMLAEFGVGHVSDTVQVDSVLETGIEAGYQTLDVLASLVFGAVLVKSAEEKGYH